MSALRPEPVPVLGPYRLTRLLAAGSTAEMYEGHLVGPHGFDKRLAIKRILPELAVDARWSTLFCEEARLQASLNHSNLVQVIDFGAIDGELFIVMEFVDGMSCAELIQRVAARRRRIDAGVALYLIREVLRALEYVHDATDERGVPLGLLHGDLAPDAVLIGSAGQVKLCDFGLARAVSRGGKVRNSASTLRNKLAYVAPEQLSGEATTRRSDLFSVGVVLAELLITGPLFDGDSEREIITSLCTGDLSRLRAYGWHLGDDIRRILETALAVNPQERYQSAASFRSDVEAALMAIQGPSAGHELAEWLAGLGLIELRSGVRQTTASTSSKAVSSYRPTQARLYRLRAEEGVEEGPFTAAELLRRVATGRLPDDIRISRGDEPYAPITALPEVQGLWARHPYRFSDPLDPRVSRHPIEPGSLATRLLMVSLSRRSGLLCAESKEHQFRIYFDEGNPVFASSTDPSTLLGAQLLESGAATAGSIEAALARGWKRDEPLGATLVLRGFLSPAALQSALESQMERRLTSLARLRNGSLAFVPGARSAMPDVPLLRSGAALIVRALERAYSAEEIAQLLLPIWHSELRASPQAMELAMRMELSEARLEWVRRIFRGCSTASLVNEVSGDQEKMGDALSTVLIGLASGMFSSSMVHRTSKLPR